MPAFQYDPADLDESTLDDLDHMSDDEITALFERPYTGVEVLLLAGLGRPATRAPHPIDPYRELDTLPPIDDYREATR